MAKKNVAPVAELELDDELELELEEGDATMEFTESEDEGYLEEDQDTVPLEIDVDQIGAAAADHIMSNPQSFEALAQRIATLVAKQFKAPSQPTRVNLVFSQPKQKQAPARQTPRTTQMATRVTNRTSIEQDDEETDAPGPYRMKPTRMVAKKK